AHDFPEGTRYSMGDWSGITVAVQRRSHGSKSSLAAARDIRFMPTATPPAIAKCCGPRTFHSAGASARGMTTPNVALVAARALMAGGIRSDSAAFASPPPPQHAGEHPA